MLRKILGSIFQQLPSSLRKRLIQELGRGLSSEQMYEVMQPMVRDQVGSLSAAEALRFLLRLDAFLYRLQGHQAIRYDNGLHTKYRHTRYHDFFVDRIQKGQKVIDIGCGGGLLAFKLARKGANVSGIDISQANIDRAQQNYSLPNLIFRQGDALRDFVTETFDVVVLSNVLEHLDQRISFLRTVSSQYQPTLLLVRVPLYERDWRVPLKQELGVEWRLDPTHEIEYTQESFAKEIHSAGLTIRYMEIRWGELWVEVVKDDSGSR
ncbi:MAG: class I SAM-dependent methyltransferase [Magnetococcales bacterium]|nr:class I SAM-dependent methyltransferase [Magnetococcales bacterium]